jgi:hypothetical protein
LFLLFVPGKLMAALAYRDDKMLARNLLSRPFFCLTPAEPFFRPDRSSTAPSCRVAVKDGRAFRGVLNRTMLSLSMMLEWIQTADPAPHGRAVSHIQGELLRAGNAFDDATGTL